LIASPLGTAKTQHVRLGFLLRGYAAALPSHMQNAEQPRSELLIETAPHNLANQTRRTAK
jgi:hypothetical protein